MSLGDGKKKRASVVVVVVVWFHAANPVIPRLLPPSRCTWNSLKLPSVLSPPLLEPLGPAGVRFKKRNGHYRDAKDNGTEENKGERKRERREIKKNKKIKIQDIMVGISAVGQKTSLLLLLPHFFRGAGYRRK